MSEQYKDKVSGSWRWPRRLPVAASFDVDERTEKLLAKLKEKFGVDTNAAVISRALALANIASDTAGPDNTVTISGEGHEPVTVALAG